MSHKYTSQNQTLNNCTRPVEHKNNAYNSNLYKGFPSFPNSPPDWMQHQTLMIQNTVSLPKISIDNFTGDPLKWDQWLSFFKAIIHNNNGLSDAQKKTYLQNSATHKARDSISGYSYNGDYYHEVIAELTRKFANHSTLSLHTWINWRSDRNPDWTNQTLL